jgi:UDP-N-acetylglucosamine/UDP-N-acetylgalactosamine diphosphorylase
MTNSKLPATYESIRERYELADQDHVFHFWHQLSIAEQSSFLSQLENIDIHRVNRIFLNSVSVEIEAAENSGKDIIKPLPEHASGSAINDPAAEAEWRSIGLDAVARGKVGVLLMAGGQGTRLGSSAPKGCYDIGLPSHKSLFQYQAERIARLQTIAAIESGKEIGSVIVPWYVMTSGPTRRETEDFFKSNSFFGLDPKNVIVFEQGESASSVTQGQD